MDAKTIAIPSYSPVCMIYSQASLQELDDIFAHYGDNGSQHGPLRIIRTKDDHGDWRDTNRTIVLISEQLFDKLIADDLYKPVRTLGRSAWDFRIVPYEIRENNLPKEGLKKDLFIRLPKEITLSTQEVEQIIKNKMEPLVKFGVIKANQYSIKIPLRNRSRSSGEAFGSCFLAFDNSVTDHTAALIKAVIDDTYWDGHDETFHCYWAREQKPSDKPYSGLKAINVPDDYNNHKESSNKGPSNKKSYVKKFPKKQ